MNAHAFMFSRIALIAILLLLAIYFVWFFLRSRSLLQRWAMQNGYEIIQSRIRWLFQGPFTGWSRRWQTVYRIKVRDRHGQERQGWALCGGVWLGLFGNQVNVEWDDTQAAEVKEGNQRAMLIAITCGVLLVAGMFLPDTVFKLALNGLMVICLAFALYFLFQSERLTRQLDQSRKLAENWKRRIRSVADTTESPDNDLTFDEFCEFEDDEILGEVVRELERMPSGQRHLKKAYDLVIKRTSKSTT